MRAGYNPAMRKTAHPAFAPLIAPPRSSRRALLGAAAGSALALTLARAANAQMRIDVSGVGATQYPIAIANFINEGKVPQDVVDWLRPDSEHVMKDNEGRDVEPSVEACKSLH